MKLLAQSNSQCTVNGDPVECSDFVEGLFTFFTALSVLFTVLLLIFFIGFIFWILSLVHLIENSDVEERNIWFALVLFVPLAQFFYYFGPRRKFDIQKTHQQNAVNSLAEDKQKL